jgi:NAD(P)-dependent dehydrogenase (short-subunit alcohol dehydrogenase family)
VFLPLLRAAAAATGSANVITLSTGAADIDMTLKSEITFGGPYAISKTGLLMAIAKYAVKYKKENIIFLSISPGLVNTATKPRTYRNFAFKLLFINRPVATPKQLEEFAHMVKTFQIGSPHWNGQPITPEESVSKMLNIFKGLTIKDTGAFISHKGNKEWL